MPFVTLLAGDGQPITTPCPTPCDREAEQRAKLLEYGCELPHGSCHERHAPRSKRAHDPDECETRRAALDEHSRLSAQLQELQELHGRIGRAMDLIGRYADIDGAHHKQWLLNQVALALTDGTASLADEGIEP